MSATIETITRDEIAMLVGSKNKHWATNKSSNDPTFPRAYKAGSAGQSQSVWDKAAVLAWLKQYRPACLSQLAPPTLPKTLSSNQVAALVNSTDTHWATHRTRTDATFPRPVVPHVNRRSAARWNTAEVQAWIAENLRLVKGHYIDKSKVVRTSSCLHNDEVQAFLRGACMPTQVRDRQQMKRYSARLRQPQTQRIHIRGEA